MQGVGSIPSQGAKMLHDQNKSSSGIICSPDEVVLKVWFQR